jgi:hypothetical protein
VDQGKCESIPVNEVTIALETVYGEQVCMLGRWSIKFDCSEMVLEKLMALCDQLEQQQLSQAEQGRRGLLEAVSREALAGPEANWSWQGRA